MKKTLLLGLVAALLFGAAIHYSFFAPNPLGRDGLVSGDQDMKVLLKEKLIEGTATVVDEAVAAPVISWGLSPNTREEVPNAGDGVETLMKQYGGLYHVDTDEKRVYFTFDLGYEAGYTDQVLDILKENNIHGIFFLCGNYLKNTELVNRMISEGHTIGNHTDRHKDLPTLNTAGIEKDIMTFQNDFTAQYPHAPAPTFFRPPQGRFDEKTLRVANENNLHTTLWSIAIVDWGKKPIDAVSNAKKIAGRVHPGAIALMHITNSGTPAMLKLLIPQIAEKSYTIGEPAEITI